MNIEKLNTAYAEFLGQPSEENTGTLITEIEAYPSYWGREMAEGRNPGEEMAKQVKPSIGYKPKRLDDYVTADADGSRLSLLLQQRVNDGTPWHTISWRTVYPGTNSNRRFYMSAKGEPWSTPIESALEALETVESKGWLVDENLDLRRRPECDVVTSTNLKDEERSDYLASFIVPGESFEDPDLFVVCEDSNLSWRKIMIMHNGRVTFRSATTDSEYGMLKHLDNGLDWNLDNSMQDCNVQQARVFLEYLKA